MPRESPAAFLAQMMGGDEPEQQSFPMREAQHDMLRQLVEVAEPDRDFKRGDPVHYFACSGPFNKEASAGLALVFWRWLSLDNIEDYDRIEKAQTANVVTLPHLDCMVVLFDGKNIKFDLACSSLLVAGDRPPEASVTPRSAALAEIVAVEGIRG